jgi:hypothetical protein
MWNPYAQFNPFEPLQEEARQEHFAEYLTFLRRRDGVPDMEARTLSARDAFFREIEASPVRWHGDFDTETFYRNLEQKTEAGLDARMVWLLGAAKANRGERYGVDLELGDPKRVQAAKDNAIGEFVLLEEIYHTRILLDACKVFGLEFEMAPPTVSTRAFIHLFSAMPESAHDLLVFVGEVVGTVCFQVLFDNVDLFAAEPKVMQRLRLLVQEILVDELGHVAYCRARLGPKMLRLAHSLLPLVARTLMGDGPEYVQLAGGREAFLRRVMAFDVGVGLDITRPLAA